ncbi:MAG: Type 1 glutamine amidotransferase-like domain-containing protein [Candidatus Pacebacteria bacterium]|nr:Type 1 glutamine amidotransferase-like domain-containing protein [Candidatus Paceibacterota bacterium]
MAAIFLTSTGLTNAKVREAILAEAGGMKDKSVAIITTADDEKEKGMYCQLALKQFQESGCPKVDFVDLEITADYDFSGYDIIYVSGGSTFRLLKFAKEADFRKSIEGLLKRGGIYIGVSAGSCVMCPSIEISEWKIKAGLSPDKDRFGLTDLSAFAFVPFLLAVHYEPDYAKVIKENAARANYPVRVLTDEQAFLIKDGKTGLIGEGEEVVNQIKA